MNFVEIFFVELLSLLKEAQWDVFRNKDQRVGRARRKWKNQRKKLVDLLLALREFPQLSKIISTIVWDIFFQKTTY